MSTKEAKYKTVGFFYLVCDASFGYFQAKEQNSFYEENRCARWSILSSALSIESFANCLLETLSLSNNQFRKLDRLPSLGKIDEYLKLSGVERLDQDKTEVKSISELIRARNDFVHVKTSRTELQISPATLQSTDTPRYDAMLNPETHPNLGIFKLGAFWHSDEARMALQAVSDFLRYSLALVDDDNSRSLRNNLVTKLEAAGVALSIMSEDYTNELEKLRHEGIDFTFLLDDD
jgi:hypothetical protein